MIPNFDWQLLVDTNSFKIVYIALPKTEKKDTSRRNLMVLDFVNTGNAIKYELTNTEEYFLLHLLTDSSSFDAGDCGTFELEGGFVVYKKEELAAYINLGCGYNQWVFHPANSFARPGSLNEQGFWKMQALLDNINKRKSEQP